MSRFGGRLLLELLVSGLLCRVMVSLVAIGRVPIGQTSGVLAVAQKGDALRRRLRRDGRSPPRSPGR